MLDRLLYRLVTGSLVAVPTFLFAYVGLNALLATFLATKNNVSGGGIDAESATQMTACGAVVIALLAGTAMAISVQVRPKAPRP
jgi:hypothetical protein